MFRRAKNNQESAPTSLDKPRPINNNKVSESSTKKSAKS